MSGTTSPAQHAFIDSLYERIGTPFSKRQHPRDSGEASALITQLQWQIDDEKDRLAKEKDFL